MNLKPLKTNSYENNNNFDLTDHLKYPSGTSPISFPLLSAS
ncbi:hypothetical protein HMPREF0204_13056 [Chryseobacterium gleum ATCC 35910]|uniref:Uncharacterized protein n=1 Tax=Chryseobacterium gleum ATCC 35910 TaxID=525257 RepID=A0ABN0ALR8_CHRGE|nr:hypothetical protein HMPREF0204_13056 [Chryseobacterium gleum ATCC 35910]